MRFVFIEEREDRFKKLQEVINREFPILPKGVQVEFHQESCEHVWEQALDQASAWGMPIFANLDPFGTGVPYKLVERLGANRSSEVLVTFMSDWLRRFWSLEHLDDGDIQFGNRDRRQVGGLDGPEKKELFLVEAYRETLARARLALTAPFRLTDEGGHSFYLIFGTSHEVVCRETADSLSWRRFCRIPLGERVPHPTTLMKITTRCGPDTVEELNGALLAKAADQKVVKLNRVRADTTVVEANVQYPTDSGLLARGVAKLAGTVTRLKGMGLASRTSLGNRTRSMRRRTHAIGV